MARSNSQLGEALLEDRLRIATILESPEGLRNPAVARELALRSPSTASAAIALLRNCPAENPYLAAMNREGAVGIAADPSGPGGDAKAARIAEIKRNTAGVRAEYRGP